MLPVAVSVNLSGGDLVCAFNYFSFGVTSAGFQNKTGCEIPTDNVSIL